ncbi:MAG: hypothetical protein VX644_07555, partial [Planctomycetota bacterium]|nr:hypothetical protein [Planctomycetota bacterium]
MKREIIHYPKRIGNVVQCWILGMICLLGCAPEQEAGPVKDTAESAGNAEKQPGETAANKPAVQPDDPEQVARIEKMGGEVQKDSEGHVIVVDFGGAFGGEVDFSALQGVPSVQHVIGGGGPAITDEDLKQLV